MLLATLLTLATTPGWALGELPQRHILLEIEERPGIQVVRYGPPALDVDDAPLVLTAQAPNTAPPAPHTTVHGRPAEFTKLTDDGREYGRRLRWREPSGVELTLEHGEERPMSDTRLHALAESVREVPPDRWETLKLATSPPPRVDRLPPGTKAVVVRRERGWTLTALLPPRFPVAPEDRRAACYHLRVRGERRFGFDCNAPATWRRVGGTIFVYGTVPARVKRVRVVGRGVNLNLRARTVPARGYPLARFYAVPLPDNACTVDVFDADRRGIAAEISTTGPLPGESRADRRRCLKS